MNCVEVKVASYMRRSCFDEMHKTPRPFQRENVIHQAEPLKTPTQAIKFNRSDLINDRETF